MATEMDEWLEGEDAKTSDVQQPAKKQAVGSRTREENATELNHMILSAQTDQTARQILAVAWWSVIMDASILQPVMAIVKEHAVRTKGQSGHKHGSPHIQA